MKFTHEMSLTVRAALQHYENHLKNEIAAGCKGGFYETEQLPSVEKCLTFFDKIENIPVGVK